jgi:DNA polymerase-3 subunit delta
MTILKLNAFEEHLARKSFSAAYLVYGPDPGKVGEVARRLVTQIAGSPDDPFTVARLDDDTLVDDPARLADEVASLPMWGSRKAVWVASAGAGAARAFELLGSPPGDGNVIVAEGGNLQKSARLRGLFEKSPYARAIPCYEDTLDDLDALIDDVFAKAGLKLGEEEKNLLLGYLGEDRALSRAELEKLILYCHGKDEVTLADIDAVCSGKTTAEFDELSDAIFSGDMTAADSLIDRHLKAGVAGSRLLSIVTMHAGLVERLALDVEAGTTPVQAARQAHPPVFFDRHPSISQQLNIWDGEALVVAARSLAYAVEQTRGLPSLAEQITTRCLLSLTRMAAARRSGK